jgi:putative CocE/NonD family hydrolase
MRDIAKTTRALLLLCLAAPGTTLAQAPNAGNYSSAQYAVRESRGHKVPMRDGVHLSVDIYRPDASGRLPGILSITPYDNTGPREQARWFAQRGYVVVVADSRGRYDSEGVWDPFTAKHKTDGYDLVEWMAKQDWSNGRVGMIGGSYGGWTQWWTASAAPPSLKAIAPQVAPPDHFYNAPYQEGVLVGWTQDWAAWMAGRTGQIVDTGAYGGFTNTRARDLRRTPYVDILRNRGDMDAAWYDTWIRSNKSTDEYWKGIAYQGRENYSRITVPTLNMTGWFDADYPGSPMNYLGMKQFGATPEARRPVLMIGPWPHGLNLRRVGVFDYGPNAVIDLNGYIARWYDHWLKGIDNGVEKDPPVYVFVMGPNRWYAETDWPLPQTQWTKYYFRSGGKANSVNGDGVLTTEAPTTTSVDQYVYDPATPTRSPWPGGHTMEGAIDSRLSFFGNEVLVYTTPPLTEEVEVTGPVEAKLFASTSARDTDWMVRLIDVHPDGYNALLTEGVMRARNRDPQNAGVFNPAQLSTITPNQVYEYTIKFWRGTGNVFAKGHRIRVEISSSYYPYYLRNLNTGADNVGLAREAEAVVATQRVHNGPRYPSHIVLPVIPARGTATQTQ